MWSQPVSQRAIIVAGCLGTIYTYLTMSPATVEFARSLGATGWHIGILGALPMAMLFTQFLAAVLANHLTYRRRAWFWMSIAERLSFLPLALGPWLLPECSDATWLWLLIVLTAANHAMLNFSSPLWLSWMGDYLPHAGLSRYWGIRHLWMQLSAAVALFAGAVFLLKGGFDIRPAFSLMMGAGAVFGIADILTFIKVDEHPVTPMPEPKLREVLTSPFRDGDFRSFICFSCFWNVAAMTSSPFISFFLLGYVGMDVYHVMLLWTYSWLGGAFYSKRIGQLVEQFGNRPVLVLSTAFKSVNMIALIVVPRDPVIAFWIMVPIFMLDAVLNAGITIANNGFMIKNSPAQNRTMFIAAGTAMAGMAGGVASVATGAVLAMTSDWSYLWGSTVVTNLHIAFAVSLVLRLAAAVLARRVREPKSQHTIDVVVRLIGVAPIRVMRYPVGLYRSIRNDGGHRQASRARRPATRAMATSEREIRYE
ncbi:MAG: MFS transporter [Planctomycetaceae bacterium]